MLRVGKALDGGLKVVKQYPCCLTDNARPAIMGNYVRVVVFLSPRFRHLHE